MMEVVRRLERNRKFLSRAALVAGLTGIAATLGACGGDAPPAESRSARGSGSAPSAPADPGPATSLGTTTTAPQETTSPPRSTVGSPTAASPTATAGRVPPADPAEPFDAARTAEEIVLAESAIRSGDTPEADLARHGRAQQRAYRRVAERPERLALVLDLVPPGLVATVEANVKAGRELRALTKPRTELPRWRVVPPPPAGELRSHYQEAQSSYGAPWEILAAIHLVETRMGRIRGTSSAGAQGPMQFMPPTWARYGEGGNVEDARDSILAAGRYLKASGVERDLDKALYAYNHSDRYVRAVRAYAGQIEADERAYLGYYQWQVYVITTRGDVLLEEGYGGG